MRQRLDILKEKMSENNILIHALLILSMVVGFILAILGRRLSAFRFLSQTHRSSRWFALKKIVEPWIISNLDIHKNLVPTDVSLQGFKNCFGSRLMVLKEKVSPEEKGVLYVMYSEFLHVLPKYFDMDRLTNDYILVFEPSWSGYCSGSFLHYALRDEKTYFLAAQKDDFRFLTRIKNLVPIGLGPCDWVDPRIAEPYLNEEKKFDVVMNSNWGAWKRHRVLFAALRKIQTPVKVALIGFEWGGKKKIDIENLAKYYGVFEQIEIFENIPFQEVVKVVCQSRISILLSLKEGSNRAISESIFCNVPVIVLANHVGGIVKNVVAETGELVKEKELGSVMSEMLRNLESYKPREWALDNISCIRSTEILNEKLRQEVGGEWTQDIHVRSNSPESTYYFPEDKQRMLQHNEGLGQYIKRNLETSGK